MTESADKSQQTGAAYMTNTQFDVVTNMIRARSDAMSAARLVLVHGISYVDAIKQIKSPIPISSQMLNNTVGRIRNGHERICTAYTPKPE